MPDYLTLVFTSEFMESLERLSSADRRRVRHALGLLDSNEQHPSLNIHQLEGKGVGTWTAYASRSLRVTFERLVGGRKRLIEASQHYGD